MLGAAIFLPLLVAICLYALWRGGTDERIVALTCLGGTVATLLTVSPLTSRYTDIESGLALVDFVVLAGFVGVALRSNRFWPLWVAGLQLTTALGHGFKALDGDLFRSLWRRAAILELPDPADPGGGYMAHASSPVRRRLLRACGLAAPRTSG